MNWGKRPLFIYCLVFIFSIFLLVPWLSFGQQEGEVPISPVRKGITEGAESEIQGEDKGQKMDSENQTSTTQPIKFSLPTFNLKEFVYSPQNRMDPFRSPLFATKVRKKEKEKKILTPLQMADVSNFKLVGIIWGELGNKALIESSDGKAYILKKGMAIGINDGEIVDIKSDEVVIVEYYYDYLNNKKEKYCYLKLQKR